MMFLKRQRMKITSKTYSALLAISAMLVVVVLFFKLE